MFKQSYNVIGVMSGTSLDGIDLAHIHFSIPESKWSFQILESETVSYSIDWLNKLKVAVTFSKEELQKLNEDYTILLGEIIKSFIKKNDISNLDAVCSHGHTILHQPQNGFTLQIGNLPEIVKIINEKVVCDFRVQDVELGEPKIIIEQNSPARHPLMDKLELLKKRKASCQTSGCA